MKAKYSGNCPHCGKRFYAGDEIEKRNAGWCPVNCRGCTNLDAVIALEKRMKEKHLVTCGLDFDRDDYHMTGTRQEFLDIAIRLGEATSEEVEAFRAYHVGGMHRDLFD